jgi:hypothetical protein
VGQFTEQEMKQELQFQGLGHGATPGVATNKPDSPAPLLISPCNACMDGLAATKAGHSGSGDGGGCSCAGSN